MPVNVPSAFLPVATSHLTFTSELGIPPPFRGFGASRVHNTMLAMPAASVSGSPEATPSVKGSPRVEGYSEPVDWAMALFPNIDNPLALSASAAVLMPVMAKKSRRLIRRSQLPVMLIRAFLPLQQPRKL